MSWIEILLVIAGISLDIFGAIECQGALVKKVDKKNLAIIVGLVAIWQTAALFIGYFLAEALYRISGKESEKLMGHVIAIIVFFTIGAHLLVKVIRNEQVEERCEMNLGLKRFVKMAAKSSGFTLLAGAAFGLLDANIYILLVCILILSIIVVITGMYTGYRFGYEQKTKAYIIGTVMLWSSGVSLIIRYALK